MLYKTAQMGDNQLTSSSAEISGTHSIDAFLDILIERGKFVQQKRASRVVIHVTTSVVREITRKR
jgi:hypothetical protein